MSGPVEDTEFAGGEFGVGTIEVKEGRVTQVGGSGILRVLPTKRRRAIGPWCFVDLMAPDDIENPPPLEIGPHPHIGLSTVTWLFAGSALHTDSLGTEQPIRPGQLNLMTAGRGIAHAEEGLSPGVARDTGGIMGAQMWLAQTESSRHGGSRFQHIEELPVAEMGTASARVLIGTMGDAESPARVDHPTLGVDLALRSSTIVPVEAAFEYGVVPIDRPVKVEDTIVEPGSIAVVAPGRDQLSLETRGGEGRLLLLGGEPLGAQLKMWWNFVARTADEITEAWRDWRDHNRERFGEVPSGLRRIEAPRPPWVPADS